MIGKFRLVRELGGRPGTWIARRKTDGELVVLHRIPAGARGVAVLADARRTIDAEHANVVRVRAVEMAGMDVVVVTEFVDGEVYADLVDAARERGTPLPLNVSLRVIVDLLNGFAALHARRPPLVHGRLAALDVLVGADGISRIAIGARNVRGDEADVMGYFAPEIILTSDLDSDERTDVYAAGVLLWEALAGQRLYDATSAEIVLSRQLRGQIPIPELAHDIHWAQPLISVAVRALATDPKDRYPCATAMLEALRDAAGRRVARPDDVASWVEQISGPFIRARRREASVSLGASDSDIRPTERDTEPDESDEPTLSLAGDAPEVPTEVDVPNPLVTARNGEAATSGVPRLNAPDEDETDDAATEVQEVDADTLDPTLTAERRAPQHPADAEKPTVTVDVPAKGREPAEDPSVTSTLPPAVKRALLAKHAALLKDDDGERSTQSAPTPKDDDDYGEESITARRANDTRRSQESITLDMPKSIERTYDGDLATERRQAQPRAAAGPLARTARSPGTAPSDDQETVDMAAPGDARAVLDESKARGAIKKSGKRPRSPTEEELAETAQMGRSAESHVFALGTPRTAPIAIPVQRPPLAATAPMVDAPPYPYVQPVRPGPMVPAPPVSDPRPPVVVPPPPPVPSAALHPTVPGQRIVQTVSTTRERGSSFLLGVVTFFLVLASLMIIAWLTMPYWRAYVEL